MGNTKFTDLKKEYNKLNDNKDVYYQEAMNLLDKAKYEEDKDLAYKYAKDAYELAPSHYDIYVYAICLLDDKTLRLKEFESLYNDVTSIIDNYDNDNVISIYPSDESNSYRFNHLCYQYACALIENNRHDEALILLNRVNNPSFQKMHLVFNICLDNKYEDIFSEFDEDRNANVCTLLPLSLAYIKTKNYIKANIYINLLKKLNKYVKEIVNLVANNDIDTIDRINKQNTKYLYNTKEEVYFALKYFIKNYQDEEFIKLINK